MAKRNVTLVIDDRENEDVVAAVSQHPEVENWFVDRLEIGDIQCKQADVLFERKTMSDYASSLTSGHLNDQVERMRELSENTFILVGDDMRDSDNISHTAIKGESVRGSMASNMARRNTPVIPCSNTDLLVDIAVRISRKFIEEPGSAHLQASNVGDDEPTVKQMYACLPDIGPEKAGRLYEEFPTVPEVMAVSEEKLTEVEGIGDKTAEKIKEELYE